MDPAALGVYACLFLALYLEVFLLISFFEKRPARKDASLPRSYPTVSMLVPVWNEEKTVLKTLESLRALEYPKEKLEIVVIDDGSADRTRQLVESYIEELHGALPAVRFFHKENGGKWTALNLGIGHSQGELVGCLDADSFVAPDGLIEMIKKFESDPSTMAITPAMKVNRPRKMLELMQAVEYTFGIFYKKMFDNLSAINVLPGPFSMYRREVFEKIGLFRHAHNTEDMEIAFRMHAYGLKIANAHTAHVYTTVPSTLRGLIKQRTRWSQGFLENSRDYYYMYFNPRYGNFGMLALPFLLAGFAAGLYTAGYLLYRLGAYVTHKIELFSTTHLPLTAALPHAPQWLYIINTSMLTFLIIFTLTITLTTILLGQRIADTRLTIKSFVLYFTCFGFIAPVWLARAAWGALRSQESAWR